MPAQFIFNAEANPKNFRFAVIVAYTAPTSTGGGVSSGTAPKARARAVFPVGGGVSSGAAPTVTPTHQLFLYEGSGGGSPSGTSGIARTRARTGSGGGVPSGFGTIGHIWARTGSGGGVPSGAADTVTSGLEGIKFDFFVAGTAREFLFVSAPSQFLRPVSDPLAPGLWKTNTGATVGLAAALAETFPDDVTFIRSDVGPFHSKGRVRLATPATVPSVRTGHVVHFRMGKHGVQTLNVITRLVQGGTTIWTKAYFAISSAILDFIEPLTTVEATLISSTYAALDLEWEVTEFVPGALTPFPFLYQPSGGAFASGVGLLGRTRARVGVGGGVPSGSAGKARVWARTAATGGGAVSSGTVGKARIRARTGSGGGVSSGAAITVYAPSTPGAPAIPSLSGWETDMTSGASTYCNQTAINAAIFAGAGTGGDETNVWYYDGNLVYQQVANYTGNAANYTCGGYVETAYGAWVDSIIGSATTPQSTLQGHRVFSHGFLNSWFRTGSTTARERVRRLALYSAWAGSGGNGKTDNMRETAYCINAYVAADYAGFGVNSHLAASVGFAKSEIDKVFVSHVNDGTDPEGLKPFMLGLLMDALIYYYGRTRTGGADSTIPAYIQKCCDGLFTDTFWTGSTFWVPASNAFIYGSAVGQRTPAPLLNQLIAPAFAWLWQMGFGDIYRQRFDLIFAGGVATTLSNGQEYSENYRASFDGIRWRSSAPGALQMYPYRAKNAGIAPIGDPLAFPGALGFGALATGGRGGTILRVTNLNDSGLGSLRAACNTNGARHIVFEVSGTINLLSDLSITNQPNFSIWGETAPSPGIQIRNFGLVIRSSNFIVRHLTFRPEAGPDARDGIRIVRFTGDAYAVGNGIIDHCTAQWAGDENISIFPSIDTPITDVTIQNTLMCESMEDGCLIADNVDRISVINNVIAKNEARHPRVHTFANLEIINNISYFCGNDDIQVGGTSATGGATPCNLSVINNRFIDGPVAFASNGCIDWEDGIWDDGTSKLYHTGNVHIGSVNRPIFLNKHLTQNPIVSTPPLSSGMTGIQAADATFETWLLARVGSRPNQRDSGVTDVITDVTNRTGALAPHDTLTGYGAPITYASNTATFTAVANPNGDDDGDGYTNVEEQIHALAAALTP